MTATRKRQRTTKGDGEDDAKKPRGRPRVDSQEESAADRRRTQIRLAQRAYRQRKESTINTLQDQVTSLESTIEEMGKAFLAFNDKLVGSKMLQGNEKLVQELRKTTQQFLLLAKTSDTDSDEPGSEPDVVQDQSTLSAPPPQQHNPAPPESDSTSRHVDIGLGYVQILDDDDTSSKEATPEPSVNINISKPITDVRFPSPVDTDLQVAPQFDTDFTLFSSDNTAQVSTASTAQGFPSPPCNSSSDDSYQLHRTISVKAPYTFSFEESTFSRRLHRAALERGHHILATAHTRPNGFKRTFKLSLLYHNRDTLLFRVRKMLAQPVNQPLEFYHTPFIHLGGAGTHYSKGRRRNAYIIKVGPVRKTARLENAETGKDAGMEFELDWKDYEGEWFDPNDVEGFLEALGITINPRSTFAEAVVPDSSGLVQLLKKNNLVASPVVASPPIWPENTNIPSLSLNQGTLNDGSMGLLPELGLGDLNSFSWANDMSNASGWVMGSGDRTPEFLASGWANSEAPSGWQSTDALNLMSSILPTPSKTLRKISLDVGSFVDYLIKTAICLGRAPGFRKRDVEKALLNSIIEFS